MQLLQTEKTHRVRWWVEGESYHHIPNAGYVEYKARWQEVDEDGEDVGYAYMEGTFYDFALARRCAVENAINFRLNMNDSKSWAGEI